MGSLWASLRGCSRAQLLGTAILILDRCLMVCGERLKASGPERYH